VKHNVAGARDGQFPSDAGSFTVGESKAAPAALEPAPYSSPGAK